MTRKLTLLLAFVFLLTPLTAFAQFGQNQVIFEKTIWNSYESEHFEYLFSVDMTKDLSKIKSQENPRVSEIIREMSRLKYGRDVRLVDAEMIRRSNL